MDRLGVDWWQGQPRSELDLNTLRVGIVGDSGGHLALIDVYGWRQRAWLGSYDIPGSGRALQVERLEGRSVVVLVEPGHTELLRLAWLDIEQKRSGRLSDVESLVRRWWRGHIELQHISSVATEVVVSQGGPNVSNLAGQSRA